MLSRLGNFVCRWSERLVPDPWVFALALTLAAGASGVLLGQSPGAMLDAWGRGFWELLAFSMQMCLVLVTGHALAESPLLRNILRAAAGLPRSGAQAAALTAFFSCALALLNWGLGLVGGALLARETAREGARRGIPMHYPLLGAAGYAGLLVWHGGLSGSAPLTAATPGHFLEKDFGLIPLSQTLFASANLAASLAMLAVVPALCWAMAPRRKEEIREARMEETPETAPPPPAGAAARLAHSPAFTVLAAGLAAAWLARLAWSGSFALTLDMVNFVMLFAGMALHGTPARYAAALSEAVRGCAGIVLQFPFYAGIMGMVKYGGIGETLAAWSAGGSSQTFFALRTFLSASVLNVFVPSGGGQWAIQGPVALSAAKALGMEPGRALMAVAYGDQLTNMLQPFWALPLLGLTKMEARDILGYAFVFMLAGALVFALALCWW